MFPYNSQLVIHSCQCFIRNDLDTLINRISVSLQCCSPKGYNHILEYKIQRIYKIQNYQLQTRQSPHDTATGRKPQRRKRRASSFKLLRLHSNLVAYVKAIHQSGTCCQAPLPKLNNEKPSLCKLGSRKSGQKKSRVASSQLERSKVVRGSEKYLNSVYLTKYILK